MSENKTAGGPADPESNPEPTSPGAKLWNFAKQWAFIGACALIVGSYYWGWVERTPAAPWLVAGLACALIFVSCHNLFGESHWVKHWLLPSVVSVLVVVGTWLMRHKQEASNSEAAAKPEPLAITVTSETRDSETRALLDTLPISEQISAKDTNRFLIERHATSNVFFVRLNHAPVRSSLRISFVGSTVISGTTNNIVWLSSLSTNVSRWINVVSVTYIPRHGDSNLLDMRLIDGSVRLEPAK